jgi:hypothetical protein
MERLLVGAVSPYCLSHAECPIVTVLTTKVLGAVGPLTEGAASLPHRERP